MISLTVPDEIKSKKDMAYAIQAYIALSLQSLGPGYDCKMEETEESYKITIELPK